MILTRISIRVICIVVLSFLSLVTHAQIFPQITKEDVVKELEKRNLDVDEVEQALLEEGIDINTLDVENITSEDRLTIQRVILEMTAKAKEDEKQKEDEASEEESDDDLDDTEAIINEEVDSLEAILLLEEQEEEIPEVTIYGQELFRRNIIKVLDKNDEINAPDSYVLGPGDKLVLSIWGRVSVEREYVIRPDGYINVDNNNGNTRIFLKGLTLGDARDKIKKTLQRQYSFNEGQFNLALNFSRTVKVSVLGEVIKLGVKVLPAFNSPFNALAAAGGTTDIGSLRKILLQKNSGDLVVLDVYELLKDPSSRNRYYLEDNDLIIVPASQNIITLEGAVKRPLKYELIDGEGIKELLEYAGGFAENAYKKKIQVRRFIDDDQKIIDIDWRDYSGNSKNFPLLNGDFVIVEAIDSEPTNFVEVIGEVKKEGIIERSAGMRVSDAVLKAGLTENSSTNLVYLTRTNDDGTISYEKLYLNEILSDKSVSQNIFLKNKDKIEIWSKERFIDNAEITVSGSVRSEGKFPFDASRSIRLRDAILLAGGLRRDASDIAIIHRNDPLNPQSKSYKTVDNLEEILSSPDNEYNYIMEPFDSLVVESKDVFIEESFVRIEGAVNRPGSYQYGEGITIRDLMILAGGFRLAASTNNIEVSRVIMINNEPTKSVVANLEMNRDFDVLSKGAIDGSYKLEPYDNISVRYNKDFELQKRVFLKGEVEVPGPYAVWKSNLRISDVIERAGGLTEEAFPAGATLIRMEEEVGPIVIKLDEIMTNPNSEFNFIVKNGDEIFIPKISEFVTIKGATRVREVVSEDAIEVGNEIRVPFHKNKDALFYINEFAGGLDEKADKKKILVRYANGEIKRPKNGLFVKKYPKVLQGSTITVGYKTEEQEEQEKKTDVDWTQLLGDSVSQAMSILTLILLISRLDD
jgi:protein involved in polysaccharide export with SLBB domain